MIDISSVRWTAPLLAVVLVFSGVARGELPLTAYL